MLFLYCPVIANKWPDPYEEAIYDDEIVSQTQHRYIFLTNFYAGCFVYTTKHTLVFKVFLRKLIEVHAFFTRKC